MKLTEKQHPGISHTIKPVEAVAKVLTNSLSDTLAPSSLEGLDLTSTPLPHFPCIGPKFTQLSRSGAIERITSPSEDSLGRSLSWLENLSECSPSSSDMSDKSSSFKDFLKSPFRRREKQPKSPFRSPFKRWEKEVRKPTITVLPGSAHNSLGITADASQQMPYDSFAWRSTPGYGNLFDFSGLQRSGDSQQMLVNEGLDAQNRRRNRDKFTQTDEQEEDPFVSRSRRTQVYDSNIPAQSQPQLGPAQNTASVNPTTTRGIRGGHWDTAG